MAGEREWSRAAHGSDERPPWTRPIPPEASRAAARRAPRAPPRSAARAAGSRHRAGAGGSGRPSKAARREE
eukprot:13926722-Alexandrium_andersonii.AAC.1